MINQQIRQSFLQPVAPIGPMAPAPMAPAPQAPALLQAPPQTNQPPPTGQSGMNGGSADIMKMIMQMFAGG